MCHSHLFGFIVIASLVIINNAIYTGSFKLQNRSDVDINGANKTTNRTALVSRAELANATMANETQWDDRLYFEVPKWFQKLKTTKLPLRFNTDTLADIDADLPTSTRHSNHIRFDGEYNFRYKHIVFFFCLGASDTCPCRCVRVSMRLLNYTLFTQSSIDGWNNNTRGTRLLRHNEWQTSFSDSWIFQSRIAGNTSVSLPFVNCSI